MEEIKCRYCGGNLANQGDGTGKCESCGSRLILPRLNAKISENLYNRADHLRRIHDYDGAISAYEHIVAENPADPEARWSLVLCKYGVEYTYDRRTSDYLPTINRMSLESILEDRDYLKALEYADETAREEYRRQANRLAAIQDELEKIVRENENYDVFISFKATDENRKRTRDYFLAQEIYDALTASGLRVFFSPVTLRAHVGEVYEPYIFAALYSSRVLVLVGTKREYLDSEWVKNEWSRYLFMTRSNPEKHLIPVCEGMKPEDFPAGIGKMQAVSMNAVGALELLRERVLGYTTGQEKRIYVKSASGEKIDLTNQMRRLRFAVEDGDFEEASDWLQKLRGELGEKEPELAYPALLVKYQARDETELAAHMEELEQDADYRWLVENGSQEQKKLLADLEEQRKRLAQRQIEKQFIDRLSELYRNNAYGRIIREVEKARRETVFERENEIDDFYRGARQKEEAEKLLKSYQNTVGDGSTFFAEKLKEKHPEKSDQLMRLLEGRSGKKNLSVPDRIVGAGWLIGLVILAIWFVLKESFTTAVLLLDIALYLVCFFKHRADVKAMDEKAPRPYILLLSFITFAVSLVAANFLLPNEIRGFCEFWGGLFGEGDSDSGMMVYAYFLPLLFMMLWSLRISRNNREEKQKIAEAAGQQKELLAFLKHFEKQEEILLLEKYAGIDEKDRVPLQSLYTMLAKP